MRRPIRLPALPGVARPRGTGQRQAKSELEALLYMQVTMAGLHHGCVAQYRFALPEREYRSDLAWPTQRLLVEVEGAIWSRGTSGHKGGTGITRDCEKANLATLRGWRCLRFVEKHIKSGEAVQVIAEALGRRVGR